MSQQLINIGNTANDGTGVRLRDAFRILNENFSEVYTTLSGNLTALTNATFSGNVRLATVGRVGGSLYTLPLSDGGVGQVLTTDGSSLLSWTNNGSGAPPTQLINGTSNVTLASNGNLAVSLAGTSNLMVITTAGLVGIGTASPAKQLHVYSSTAAVLIDTGASASANPELQLGAVARQFNVGVGGATFATVAVQGSYYLYDATAAAYRFVIDAAGKVGIGTTTPGGKLDVVGGRSFFAAASEPYGVGARYISTGGAVYFGASNGTATPDAQISSAGGGALMTLQNGGNVGIGGLSPSARLHVQNVADETNTFLHMATNSGGSAVAVYILDDRGFSGVNSGKTLRVVTRNDGLNDTGAIASFETIGGSVTNALWVGISGNVGIGTTSPGTKLEVMGSITARAAATQDSVILAGRAGGTSGHGVTLTPTTLTAARTVTLADGNTTLASGTMAVTGGNLAQFAATTSAQLAGVISDETGSGALVFATSPTITTSAVIPLVIGGTAVSSTLTLQSTSGAGTTDAIIFRTGSQSERMRILTTGQVGIGTSSPATEAANAKLAVVGTAGQSAGNLATSNSNAGFTVRGNVSSGYQLAIGATSVDGSPYLQGLVFNGGSSASSLILQGYGGYVGIGTASPGTLLEVSGTITASGLNVTGNANVGNIGATATVVTRSLHTGVAVSALPAAAGANAGAIQYITDASATTIGNTVAGGGANKVMVWSNGSNWKIFAS